MVSPSIPIRRFCEEFSTCVSSCSQKEQVIIFSDSTYSHETKMVVQAKDLTPDRVASIIDKYSSNGLMYAFADTDKFCNSVRQRILRNSAAQEDNGTSVVEINKMTTSAILEAYAKTSDLRRVSARATDITYRPMLYIDIDLKDQHELVASTPPAAAAVGKENLGSREAFAKWVVSKASPDEIVSVLNHLVDLDTVQDETEPNMVLYTGHGYHIVYLFPCDGSFPESVDTYKRHYEVFAQEVMQFAGKHVVYDMACSNISRNNRMPFTKNPKSTPKKPVEIIRYNTLLAPSQFLSDILVRAQTKDLSAPATASTNTGSLLELLDMSDKNNNSVNRNGMPDIMRNSLMYSYIKKHITISSILLFLNHDISTIEQTSDKGFVTMKSPTRKGDSNPSFWSRDEMMICQDWGTGDSQDYGSLVMRLLDSEKRRLGLYASLPTTVYEAQYFLFFIAYMNDLHSADQAPVEYKTIFLSSKSDKKGGKKPISPFALEYYKLVLSSFAVLRYAIQRAVAKEKNKEQYGNVTIQILVEYLPKSFYFPFFRKGSFENEASRNNTIAKLFAESILAEQRLIYHIRTSGSQLGVPEVFLIDNNLHVPYSEYYGTAPRVGFSDKEEIDAFIGQRATELGFPAKLITQTVKQRLSTAVRGLASIELLLGKTTHKHSSMGSSVEDALLRIFSLPRTMRFDKSILNSVKESTGRKFIRFSNTNVCYDAPNANHIGATLPTEPDPVMQVAIGSEKQDLILLDRHTQSYMKMPTPLLNKFMEFMDDGENKFKRIIAYFVSHMLYDPAGDSRAVFLVGDGSNGKSVLAGVFERLLGKDEIMTVADINSLSAKTNEGAQARANVYNKLVNITPDASGEDLGSIFKTLVTGEPVPVKVLYRQPEDVYPKSSHIINTNRIPQLTGEATAFKRRVLYCQLTNIVHPKDVVPNLHDKIVSQEGPGIWHKIITASRINRLSIENKGVDMFVTPDMIGNMEERLLATNGLYEFIDSCFHIDKTYGGKLTAKTFIKAYNMSYIGSSDSRMWVSEKYHIAEINQFIRMKIKALDKANLFTPSMLQKGLKYRSNTIGLPMAYLYITADMMERTYNYDSREKK